MSPFTAVSLGALAVVLALFAYAAFVTARRLLRDDGKLRLLEALRGQGLVLPNAAGDFAAHQTARAVQRCVACASHTRCDALLEAQDWNRLREICPNTPYLDSLRRG